VSAQSGGGRGIYSIGAVARMLDLPAATLRNWEERYETIVPYRSPGGHRLYSRDQVEELRLVANEVARGLSAADAHRLLAERRSGGGAESEQGAHARPLVLLAERDPAAAEFERFFLRSEGYDVRLTFAVDDADAAAARAAELGGKVVVAPFDAPWVRTTVIADPQGATFIASKFVPENKDLGSQADSTVGAA